MTDHLFVGTHVEDLASGRTIAPGETITLSAEEAEDPHNKRLLDEELLIPVQKPKRGQKEPNAKDGEND